MGHAPIPTPLDTGLRRYDGGLVKATGEIKPESTDGHGWTA